MKATTLVVAVAILAVTFVGSALFTRAVDRRNYEQQLERLKAEWVGLNRKSTSDLMVGMAQVMNQAQMRDSQWVQFTRVLWQETRTALDALDLSPTQRVEFVNLLQKQRNLIEELDTNSVAHHRKLRESWAKSAAAAGLKMTFAEAVAEK